MNQAAKYMTVFVLLTVLTVSNATAHCQIPCGIFDDAMRIKMMYEHVTTIEKSMKLINENVNQNQTVRWVMNKEKHADELGEIVTYYFMAQRIKPGSEEYVTRLSQLHEILIHSMKAKQSTDLATVEKLRELIHSFEHSYMGEAHTH